VPGFNDSHVHFFETGQQLSLVDLRDADTPQEFARRIGEFAKKLPKGRWILRRKMGPRELDAERSADRRDDRRGVAGQSGIRRSARRAHGIG
jgi:predicted amidohydrolase YtcJ